MITCLTQSQKDHKKTGYSTAQPRKNFDLYYPVMLITCRANATTPSMEWWHVHLPRMTPTSLLFSMILLITGKITSWTSIVTFPISTASVHRRKDSWYLGKVPWLSELDSRILKTTRPKGLPHFSLVHQCVWSASRMPATPRVPSHHLKLNFRMLCITVCEIFDTVPINKIRGNGREIFKWLLAEISRFCTRGGPY